MSFNTKFSKVKKGFSKQSFMTTIGAKIKESESGKCTIVLPFHPKLTQQHGLFHGGAIAAIADNAAGFAAYSLMTEDNQPLTIEFKINFLSTANGENLITEADVIKAGKSIFHARSDVFCVAKTTKILVASALVTVKATKAISEI